jgi:MFS family permease
MTTVVSILLSDIVPLRERETWQGYANLIYAAGSTGGAPLGGILSDTIGWRWYVTGICWLLLAYSLYLSGHFLGRLPFV